MIRRKGNVYKLDTPATTLLLGARGEYLYYGGRLAVGGCEYEFLRDEGEESSLRPFSAFGGEGPFGVSYSTAEGAFFPRFVFRRAGFSEKPRLSPLPFSYSGSEEKNACQTLCFEFADEPSKLKLFVYYTVFDDSDVVAVSSRLVNGGKRELRVTRPASLQLDVFGDGYDFVSFSGGRWEGRSETPVPVGACLVKDTAAGFGAPFYSAFALLKKPACVYAAGLLYAGNARLAASADRYPRTRLRAGILCAGERTLAAGESVYSPEGLMLFAADEDGARRAAESFFAAHVYRGKRKDKEPPVLFYGGNADGREKVLENMELAAEAGAEVFVLDADVFGGRGGTDEIAARARERGMKFGLRVRLRTAPPTGGILEKRPEFSLKGRGREALSIDGRTFLDFADERVQKYAVRALSALLSETKAVCLHWENEFSPDAPAQKELFADVSPRYAEGLYAVAEKLAERFPALRVQGVADLGKSGISDFLFAGGKEAAGKKVAFYKKYRKTFGRGARYRLKDASGRECGELFVSENRLFAFAFVRARKETSFTGGEGVVFRGLDAGTVYTAVVRKWDTLEETGRFTAAGELLTGGRVPLGETTGEARIVLLEKAKRGKSI